jgi:hypothetical protein
MLPAHVPTQDWILAGFVAACALLPLLAELRVGRKRRDQDDPPDTNEGDDRDDVLLAA